MSKINGVLYDLCNYFEKLVIAIKDVIYTNSRRCSF